MEAMEFGGTRWSPLVLTEAKQTAPQKSANFTQLGWGPIEQTLIHLFHGRLHELSISYFRSEANSLQTRLVSKGQFTQRLMHCVIQQSSTGAWARKIDKFSWVNMAAMVEGEMRAACFRSWGKEFASKKWVQCVETVQNVGWGAVSVDVV